MSVSGNLLAQVLITGKRLPMPPTWIDRDTGHRIIKLTSPGGTIKNWYFHNNPFFPGKDGNGDLMVFDGWADGAEQIFAINLNTQDVFAVTSSGNRKHIIPSLLQKTREVLYQSNDVIYAVSIDTRKVRKIYEFSAQQRGGVAAVNSDGTMLAGIVLQPEQMKSFKSAKRKKDFFYSVYDSHPRNDIFVIDLKTKSFNIVHTENNWLNHVQFSPVDPDLLMFCREGPWEKVDRIWTLHVGSSSTKLIHTRSMPDEIAGHEFFSPNGKSIWYDLQAPKNVKFYLASAGVDSGVAPKLYSLDSKHEWSIHYTVAPDETWFAGDGNPHSNKTESTNKWIYMYYPEGDKMRVEKLVGMRRHDYALEPNVHISPDGKWVVFGANFEGSPQTYAVEVKKAR